MAHPRRFTSSDSPNADASDANPGATDSTSAGEPSELPEGIEPWAGDEMPEGTASNHGLRAPEVTPPTSSMPGSSPASSNGGPAVDEVNHRRMFETRFRDLPEGEREEAARHASGAELLALCFDPAPRVVAALLQNGQFGLQHARALARYHQNPQGLEIVARRAPLLRDAQVQRRLLQSIQLPEVVLERIIGTRRLLDVYRISTDRDLPERTRTRVRSRLRRCFTSADPDERAALVIKTEGRCLPALTGCTFDGRTTQILCNQSFFSTLFIQNLARFPATPSALLTKLMRSAAVRRQPQLRAILARHSNISGEWKRKV